MSEYGAYTTVTFIQVIGGKSFVIKCRACEGVGREPARVRTTGETLKWSSYEECKTCKARGMVRIESDDIPTNCGVCQGSGRQPSGGRYTDGSHTEFDNPKLCYKCNGLGILSLTGGISIL